MTDHTRAHFLHSVQANLDTTLGWGGGGGTGEVNDGRMVSP